MARWLPLIEKVCEGTARVLKRPVLEGRANTRRCYEELFDPLCAETEVWPDYTEGHYPEGTETYEVAQRKQLEFILEHTKCGPGTRMLDLGCGNGNLLRMARARGCEAAGITISRSQAHGCRAEGLDVRVCSFDQAPEHFGEEAFDVIVLNGPTEHFVSQEDMLARRGPEIYRELFESLAKMLRPGGRVFITCIHVRWWTEPTDVCRPPLEHPVGSYLFHCSVLVNLYTGWYPQLGEYEEHAAAVGLDTVRTWDATRDYYLTSLQWGERLDRHLRNHPGFALRFVTRFFWQDPRYFFTTLLFWHYGSWTWQFRPTEAHPTPMVHRWMLFQKP